MPPPTWRRAAPLNLQRRAPRHRRHDMSMMLNASFAQELSAWNLNVPGLGDVMDQWEALHRLVLDDPLGPLCAQVQAGDITTPELIEAAKGAAISSGDRDRVVAVRQAL